MTNTARWGSLIVETHQNGLVSLKITALRKGEPVSVVSLENLTEIIRFVEECYAEALVEDVL